jgi:hypothetical protein
MRKDDKMTGKNAQRRKSTSSRHRNSKGSLRYPNARQRKLHAYSQFPTKPKKRKRLRVKRVISAALVLFLFIGMGFFTVSKFSKKKSETVTTVRKTEKVKAKTVKKKTVQKTLEAKDITIDMLKKQGCPSELITYTQKYPEIAKFSYEYKTKASTFNAQSIDITGEVKKGTIPKFIQWDQRWGYRTFSAGLFAPRGCGPTCMSMIYSGLTGKTDKDPYTLGQWALKQGYYREGLGSSFNFLIQGASKLGLKARVLNKQPKNIQSYLRSGYVLIANVKKGDFTTSGHYIVIAGINTDGKLIIHDPNSVNNTNKLWDVNRVARQTKVVVGYKI